MYQEFSRTDAVLSSTREFMVFGLVDMKHTAKSRAFARNEESHLRQRQSHVIAASQEQRVTTMCAARR